MHLSMNSKAALAAAIAGLALLAGATAAGAQAPLKEVRLSYQPHVDPLPAYVAKDRGIFEKHGLNVSMTPLASSSMTITALVSKSTDLGYMVPVPLMLAKQAGIEQVIVAGSVKTPFPPGYAGVLARTGSGITKAEDLVGKKVGVVALKTTQDFLLKEWLDRKGINSRGVSFVEVSFPQQYDVLRSGQIDAVVTVDPFYNRIVSNKVGYYFDDYFSVMPAGSYLAVYIAMRPWAEQNPEVLRAFRAAMAEAISFIKANEKEARASLQRWTKQSEQSAAQAAIPTFDMSVAPKDMKFWLDLAKSQKIVEKEFKAEDFFPR